MPCDAPYVIVIEMIFYPVSSRALLDTYVMKTIVKKFILFFFGLKFDLMCVLRVFDTSVTVRSAFFSIDDYF